MSTTPDFSKPAPSQHTNQQWHKDLTKVSLKMHRHYFLNTQYTTSDVFGRAIHCCHNALEYYGTKQCQVVNLIEALWGCIFDNWKQRSFIIYDKVIGGEHLQVYTIPDPYNKDVVRYVLVKDGLPRTLFLGWHMLEDKSMDEYLLASQWKTRGWYKEWKRAYMENKR